LRAAENELATFSERQRLLEWKVAEYRTLLGECKQAVLHESPIALRAVYQREYSRMTAIQTIHTILRSENRPMKVIDQRRVWRIECTDGQGGAEFFINNFTFIERPSIDFCAR
jgi:hypothetical protein